MTAQSASAARPNGICRPLIRRTTRTAKILSLFAKDVAAATDNKLQITVHAGASLFKAPEIKRAVQTGQAQLGEVLMSLHENEDPMYRRRCHSVPCHQLSGIDEALAGLEARNREEARLAGTDAAVCRAVGPQGIYAKKDLNAVDDMKGLKWRAYNVGTARIGELIGAQVVTVQAAELPQALATGVVNSFMTSAATGYDSKAWESMTHFYDTQAWIPKNVTFVNKAAFDALDKPTQEALLKAAATARNARLEDVAGKVRLVSRAAEVARHESHAARRHVADRVEESRRAAYGRLAEKVGC